MLARIAKSFVVVLLVAVLGLWVAGIRLTWLIWHPTIPILFKDQVATTTAVLTFLFFVPASLGGLFTLIAALTPRWLSYIGLGPDLILKWEKDDPAYVHRWDRQLIPDDPSEKAQSLPAIIIRMAVCNKGLMAAESVQVVVEEIMVNKPKGKVDPHTEAKFSRLRWADSYDLDEFERVKHHRSPVGIEPFIHAKNRHFVDFAFIFEPNSEFYKRSGTMEEKDGWCVHPFYQWLPAQRENAVLKPGGVYDLCVAVSAKNYGTIRYGVTVDCSDGEMPLQFPEQKRVFDIVNDENSKSCPVKIGIKVGERQYSI
jgi:hypothetical protein